MSTGRIEKANHQAAARGGYTIRMLAEAIGVTDEEIRVRLERARIKPAFRCSPWLGDFGYAYHPECLGLLQTH